MTKKIEDLTNQKFNFLTAIKITKQQLYKPTYWLFKCDCGKEKNIIGSMVKHGYTKSCGCLGIKKRGITQSQKALLRPKGRAGADVLWSEIKGAARRRNKEFTLSKDDIFELCSQNCFYCNAPPYQISEINNKKWGRESTKLHGRFIYNSLDRVNNNLGYIKENVVPCCPTCNNDYIIIYKQKMKFA